MKCFEVYPLLCIFTPGIDKNCQWWHSSSYVKSSVRTTLSRQEKTCLRGRTMSCETRPSASQARGTGRTIPFPSDALFTMQKASIGRSCIIRTISIFWPSTSYSFTSTDGRSSFFQMQLTSFKDTSDIIWNFTI